jgi:hypothetical protein
LKQFNTYVLLSRGTCRVNLRVLREFDIALITTWPNSDLTDMDERLETMNGTAMTNYYAKHAK